MSTNISLQRLSLLAFDNGMTEPADVEKVQKELRDAGTKYQAMRTVVSMMQRGYDMGVLCGDVLKISDTTDPKLKLLCNIYLKQNCFDRPACQLMCTHTFLKDFNDRNWQIQWYATNDAVFLADEIIVKNYVYDLKRMCGHEKSVLRSAAARALGLLYQKSPFLFFDSAFSRLLKSLASDSDDSVVSAALASASLVEKSDPEKIFENSQILEMLKLHACNPSRARGWLSVLKHRNLTDDFIPVLASLISSTDVAIFYLASRCLLKITKGFMRDIFDQACGFLNLRSEQLYNILIFIETIIDHVECDGSLFVIKQNDPDYVAKIKLRLIFKSSPKNAPELLSGYLSANPLNIQIFEEYLKRGIFEKDVLLGVESCQLEELFTAILRTETITEEWATALRDFVSQKLHYCAGLAIRGKSAVKESHSGHSPLIMGLEVAGTLCTGIPDWVEELDKKAHAGDLLRFYCLMFSRGAIDQEECLKRIDELRRHAPELRRLKIVMDGIERVRSKQIFSKMHIPVKTVFSGSELLDSSESGAAESSLLDLKPFLFGEPGKKKEAAKTKEDHYLAESRLPMQINSPSYKGILESRNGYLLLTTIFVEAEQEVRVLIEDIYLKFKDGKIASSSVKQITGEASHAAQPSAYEKCYLITNPGEREIFKFELGHIRKCLSVMVGDHSFSVIIDLMGLIKPYECGSEEAEKMFAELKEFVELAYFNTANVFAIDDSTFSFEILGAIIYGKSFSSGIVLKGPVKTLECIKEANLMLE